eukprot:765580-Hanusia_phi.AAC.4
MESWADARGCRYISACLARMERCESQKEADKIMQVCSKLSSIPRCIRSRPSSLASSASPASPPATDRHARRTRGRAFLFRGSTGFPSTASSPRQRRTRGGLVCECLAGQHAGGGRDVQGLLQAAEVPLPACGLRALTEMQGGDGEEADGGERGRERLLEAKGG